MTPRAATLPFALAMAAALALRVWFVIALPFGQTVAHRLEGLNDEPAHFAYVRYLVEHRALPVQSHHVAEPGAFERADFEFYQPPLYYLVCTPLVAAMGDRAGLMACRVVSWLSGLLTLAVLASVLGRFGLGEGARRAGVAFAALLPVHVYFTSVASNDGLSWLIAMLLTRELLVRLQRTPPRGTDLRLGVLLGLGLLTKSALGVFYPILLLVYGAAAWRERDRGAIAGALVAFGLSALIAAPWYARNVSLYGSPLALEVGFGPHESGRWSLFAQAHAAVSTMRSFWFPMQHIASQPAVRALRWLEVLLAALHVSAAVWFFTRRRPLATPERLALAILAVTFASHVSLSLAWGETEGRFLLPALASIVFIIVAPAFALAIRAKAGERLAWVYLLALALHPYLFLAFA